MKTRIKILTTIAITLLTMQSFAQQANHKPPSVEERINKTITTIETRIEINESQKKVISDAFKVFFETVDELIQPGQKPEKEVIEKHEQVRDEKIKQVLSTKQYEEYLKISCMLRPKPGEHRKEGPPPHKN